MRQKTNRQQNSTDALNNEAVPDDPEAKPDHTADFDPEPLRPARAELVTDGRVRVVAELEDWQPSPAF